MLKRITSALLLGAVLVFGANTAVAQPPVDFKIYTSTGNDTLFVGIQGAIIFDADASAYAAAVAPIGALTFPFELVFSSGNVIGPFSLPPDVVPSAAAGVFESINWNANYGQGTDPDTMLVGMVDFGGPAWDVDGEVFRINVTASGEGCVRFDSVPRPGLPPANILSAVNVNAEQAPITWDGDGRDICFVIRPNEPPTCDLVTVATPTVVFGNTASGTVSGSDPDQGPGPVSYVVISAVNSAGTGPNNAPTVDGAGNWSHNTSNANDDDVGTWTLTLGVTDGEDTTACDPVTYNVIAQQPLVCFAFGCVEAFSGSDICVPLELDNLLSPCKELGGFDLLFTYDNSLLTFTGIDIQGSVLESSGWEYLTYRVVSDNPAKIRIVAIADMNNSGQHPNEWCIDGLLANICFRTTNDRTLACQSAWLMFCWDDCGDNTASSRDGNTLFMVADPANGPWVGGIAGEVEGGGIIMSSCNIDAQIFTGGGGTSGPADFPCDNPDPNKPDPEECLYFVNGKIKIKCPGDIDDRGDLNLNGLAYEIADAVLYSNFFILGPSVFAPGQQGEAQVAASDINADGTPLTVADLVYLIRVITGDAQPIAEDLLGGGPKVASVVGKINVEAVTQANHTAIKSYNDLDMGAGLFTFTYENTEITEVSVVGRASDMDVAFHAENGELRVLVSNIEDGHKVKAGEGEILSITTSGGGELELVNVEAASFMGGQLESNVTAKVLPTSFALKQNYPNPFNPSTSLAIDFPTASDYTLTIYNIAGQQVKSYAGNAEAGTLTLTWDGRDARGTQVATGVYFYKVKAGENVATKKMVMIK